MKIQKAAYWNCRAEQREPEASELRRRGTDFIFRQKVGGIWDIFGSL